MTLPNLDDVLTLPPAAQDAAMRLATIRTFLEVDGYHNPAGRREWFAGWRAWYAAAKARDPNPTLYPLLDAALDALEQYFTATLSKPTTN